MERRPGRGVRYRGTELPDRRGRAEGRLSARYRAANFPRRRVDGALELEFRGVLETDDGATILFHWEGLATLTDTGMRRLLGMAQHTSDDERYRWLNDRVCAEGEVRPLSDALGFDVVLEVSEMVWQRFRHDALIGHACNDRP